MDKVSDISRSYRPCVGIMLLNGEGQIFTARRCEENIESSLNTNGRKKWQMPQGGIDEGETPQTAALRELYEETSIANVKLLGESSHWYYYDFPANIRKKMDPYIGQRQRWFAFAFHGQESEINVLNPAGGHMREFDAYSWIDPERLLDEIVSFKRDVYRQVLTEFSKKKIIKSLSPGALI